MIKLIIFDWDDVFTQGSINGYFKCYSETLKTIGVDMPLDEQKRRIMPNWGKPHQPSIKALLKENPHLINKANKLYEKNLFGAPYLNSLTIIKGIIPFLKDLSKKYKLAIATGSHPKLLKEIVMKKFSIPNVFSVILTAYDLDDPKKTKPHPHSILEIIKKVGVSKKETVMVGDAKSDVLMALAAKVIPIVVLTGHLNKKGAENLGVNFIVKDVTKIEKVIEKINKYD